MVTGGRSVINEGVAESCVKAITESENLESVFGLIQKVEPMERGSSTTTYNNGNKMGLYKFRVQGADGSGTVYVNWSQDASGNVKIEKISN